MTDVIYDPYTPERWANPIPQYLSLLRNHPVYYLKERDLWILSRYDDIVNATKDWKTFSSALGGNVLIDKQFTKRIGSTLGTTDPPKHTQLRRIVAGVFTPKFVAGLESDIRQAARELIANFKDKHSFEAQWEFAYPYTARIISVIIGVPEEEMSYFMDILEARIKITEEQKKDPNYSLGLFRKMADYCADLVRRKRENPGDDIISKLIAVELDGKKLTDEEIGITTITLISAAFQSVAMAIGCSLNTLSKHPEQLNEVYENKQLIPDMVEESLRYDGTTIGFIRTTTKEVELHGKVIPKGARVFLLYSAGNFDERKFSNPARFDIHRKNNQHLGFGHGIHTCLGAPLSRLMMKIAYEELLPVIGNRFKVDDQRSKLARTLQFRGFSELYITF